MSQAFWPKSSRKGIGVYTRAGGEQTPGGQGGLAPLGGRGGRLPRRRRVTRAPGAMLPPSSKPYAPEGGRARAPSACLSLLLRSSATTSSPAVDCYYYSATSSRGGEREEEEEERSERGRGSGQARAGEGGVALMRRKMCLLVGLRTRSGE